MSKLILSLKVISKFLDIILSIILFFQNDYLTSMHVPRASFIPSIGFLPKFLCWKRITCMISSILRSISNLSTFGRFPSHLISFFFYLYVIKISQHRDLILYRTSVPITNFVFQERRHSCIIRWFMSNKAQAAYPKTDTSRYGRPRWRESPFLTTNTSLRSLLIEKGSTPHAALDIKRIAAQCISPHPSKCVFSSYSDLIPWLEDGVLG